MNQAIKKRETLSDLEREVIALFVRMAGELNLPRSVGEIYGLLFISTQPLCLDDCRIRLGISKGSTSQGLKILRSFGAVRTVYIPKDRKDYYVAESSLRKIVSGFASEQIHPHVVEGKERVAHLRTLLMEHEGEERDELNSRIDILENWQTRAEKLMPFILKFIGS